MIPMNTTRLPKVHLPDWPRRDMQVTKGDRVHRIMWTNKMHYIVFIFFNDKPLHVSSRLAAHHQ